MSQNKLFLISSLISSLIVSFILVVIYTSASTTIGTNIDTGGTLTVSGNVGIGTTTPNYNFVVNGTTNNFLQVASSTNQGIFIINSNGNVGIGTSSPAAELAVVGRLNLNYGTENVFVGKDSGSVITDGNKNTSLGALAFSSLTTGAKNIAIGRYSSRLLTTGNYNTSIGADSFSHATSSSSNVAIGASTLDEFTGANGDDNVAVGFNASRYGGRSSTYERNVVIGSLADYFNNGNAGGAGNVIIGYRSGSSYGDGGHHSKYGNIFIGYQSALAETGSNLLYIENSSSTVPLIYGNFSQDLVNINGILGLNESSPEFGLELATTTSSGYLAISSTAANDGDVLVVKNSGKVGIGTTTPTVSLQVATSTANATTTMEVGKANQSKGSCIKLYDTAGTAYYCAVEGGVFTCDTSSCE